MLLKNLTTLLNDPKRRSVVFITLLSVLTMLFVGGIRLLTQVRGKGFSGAAKIESMGSIRSIPGGTKKPPTKAYAKLQMEQNKRMAEHAKKTGQSAIPTIIDSFNVDKQNTASASGHFSSVQGPLSEAEQAIKDHQLFISEQQTELTKQQLQGAMYQQINQLFNTWNHYPTQAYDSRDTASDGLSMQVSPDASKQQSTLIKAGTILNAILLTELNSDEPSPVLAQITTGEFKGARLMGTLSLIGERLLVQFHSLIPKGSHTLTINALALDEATAKTSLAGFVDRHVLLRYGSLIGSTFLHEYGMLSQKASENKLYDALMANLNPTRYLQSAAGNMSTHLGSELAQQISKRPTVYVHAGTAIGVLFSSDVMSSSSKE